MFVAPESRIRTRSAPVPAAVVAMVNVFAVQNREALSYPVAQFAPSQKLYRLKVWGTGVPAVPAFRRARVFAASPYRLA
jgi:hypothetical protein